MTKNKLGDDIFKDLDPHSDGIIRVRDFEKVLTDELGLESESFTKLVKHLQDEKNDKYLNLKGLVKTLKEDTQANAVLDDVRAELLS
jgi:Ca2+-binding EF-hand superfamily protein